MKRTPIYLAIFSAVMFQNVAQADSFDDAFNELDAMDVKSSDLMLNDQKSNKDSATTQLKEQAFEELDNADTSESFEELDQIANDEMDGEFEQPEREQSFEELELASKKEELSEENLIAEESEFQQWKDQQAKEYEAFKEAYFEALDNYKKDILKHWPEAEVTSKTSLVEYDEDLQVKRVVDYENNEIRISILNSELDEAALKQKAREQLAKLIAETPNDVRANDRVLSAVNANQKGEDAISQQSVLSELFIEGVSAEELTETLSSQAVFSLDQELEKDSAVIEAPTILKAEAEAEVSESVLVEEETETLKGAVEVVAESDVSKLEADNKLKAESDEKIETQSISEKSQVDTFNEIKNADEVSDEKAIVKAEDDIKSETETGEKQETEVGESIQTAFEVTKDAVITEDVTIKEKVTIENDESSKIEAGQEDVKNTITGKVIVEDPEKSETESEASDKTSVNKPVVITIKLPTNSLAKRAAKYESLVKDNAEKNQMEPSLVFAVMHTESAFNPVAQSGIPAYGLMQIVPESAGRDVANRIYGEPRVFSPDYLFQPENNIQAGTTYLNILYYSYLKGIEDPQSRLYCAIAAYNTGAGNVAKTFTGNRNLNRALPLINAMSPDEVYKKLVADLPYDETRKYLEKVTTRQQLYMY